MTAEASAAPGTFCESVDESALELISRGRAPLLSVPDAEYPTKTYRDSDTSIVMGALDANPAGPYCVAYVRTRDPGLVFPGDIRVGGSAASAIKDRRPRCAQRGGVDYRWHSNPRRGGLEDDRSIDFVLYVDGDVIKEIGYVNNSVISEFDRRDDGFDPRLAGMRRLTSGNVRRPSANFRLHRSSPAKEMAGRPDRTMNLRLNAKNPAFSLSRPTREDRAELFWRRTRAQIIRYYYMPYR
jgi:hypothetical protein